MASSRWTEEQQELLLSVAGRFDTWPQRMQEFTNELYKRRDFVLVPEPAFTMTEIQTHFKEVCKIVPCHEPAKSRSINWNPKRTELLLAIDNNTKDEPYEVKTVLFNHAVKEKGWTFTTTLEQVERKLRRLSGGARPPAIASHERRRTDKESEVEKAGANAGAKRNPPSSSERKLKRQNVGDDGATESAAKTRSSDSSTAATDVVDSGSVLADTENGFYLSDSDYERHGSDGSAGTGGAVDALTAHAPAPDSEDSTLDTIEDEGAVIEIWGDTLHDQKETRTHVQEMRTKVMEEMGIDGQKELMLNGEEGTMAAHLRSLVNNELMSDVTFFVEGTDLFAHKCICVRCNYFKTMFSGKKSDVSRSTFLSLLEYVYTDRLNVSGDGVKELFIVANRYGIESLKRLCSKKLLESLCVDNAAGILLAATQHNHSLLRDKCFSFTLHNLEKVSKTESFHEIAKSIPEIVVKIVQKVSTLVHIG